ncbi:A-factor-processing enzyme [Metarhizium anisopliae]
MTSVLDSGGSNFVYKKTLEDGKNVNHCIETFFYVGHQGDCQARAKTRLVEQMIQEPAFDQLRTKERLGYIVFSDLRNLTTTFGLRLLVQTEKTPEHLDRRIEAFLKQFGEQLQGMSEGEFKSHKRSLIIKLLNKLDNLKQESSRHWDHIESEDYNFERNQGDAALIQPLTKSEMIEFYNSYFHPSSTTRARLSVHLEAQGAGNLDTKVIGVLKENGPEDIPQEKRQSVHLLRSYLEGEMKKSSDALNSVIEEIKKLGLSQDDQGEAVGGSAKIVDSAQGISDVRDFKAGLCVSAGAKAVKQISEFEETDKQ